MSKETKQKFYKERERLDNSSKGKYRYKYFVTCRVCDKDYWTTTYPTKPIRCSSCAGTQSYTPSKVKRSDMRSRGDGYITKQGYHLIHSGKGYVPAHRLAFPNLTSDMIVHHIDGDKLNNTIGNLVPLSKSDHRMAHGSLEKCSYNLVQMELIKYCRETNSYSLSSSMEKFIELISVNSEETLTDGAEGNSEPSQQIVGRCNDYPIEEYARSLVEARNTQTGSAEGDDIVCSA